jgi:hypothetical protein
MSPVDKIARSSWYLMLELVTAGVLVLVLLALGWMTAMASAPVLAEVIGQQDQVIALLLLLTLALALVSMLALLPAPERRSPLSGKE